MEPVRLKVAYKTPEALLGELTRSVGRGGVRITAPRAPPVGTRFTFELRCRGVADPVEVGGTVLTTSEAAPGRFLVHIRYEAPRARRGIEAMLGRIAQTAGVDRHRHTLRLPLQVRATEPSPDSPGWRLRDLSVGGVGVDAEAGGLPAHVTVGTPFSLQLKLATGALALTGAVRWVSPRSLGVAFAPREGPALGLLEDLLALRALPAPPWIARIAFGARAS